MTQTHPSKRTPVRLALASLGAAAALVLAVQTTLGAVMAVESLPKSDMWKGEAHYAALARRFPEGRIGWMLPPEPSPRLGAEVSISQYALAPRRLRNVSVTACASSGRATCGIDELQLVIVPNVKGLDVRAELARLGFVVALEDRRGVVVGRRR